MILVTGAAGRLGMLVVDRLIARGYDVLATDRVPLDESPVPFVLADLCEVDRVNGLLDGAEAVIHMGAISSTTETDADLIINNNFHMSVHLWQWCTQHRVRFIYASSAATYGDGGQGFPFGVIGPQIVEAFPDYPDLPLPVGNQDRDLPYAKALVQILDHIPVSLPPAAVATVPGHDAGVKVPWRTAHPGLPRAGHDLSDRRRQAGVWRFLPLVQRFDDRIAILSTLPATPLLPIQHQVSIAFPAILQ